MRKMWFWLYRHDLDVVALISVEVILMVMAAIWWLLCGAAR